MFMFETRAGKVSLLVLLSTISSAQSQGLPAGTIQAKVNTACAECHDTGIILQQRLSEKVWSKELDKMIKWGALVDPAERAAFIKYLSTSFPPDKPSDPVVRVARRKTR
jgi:hypothetical protein